LLEQTALLEIALGQQLSLFDTEGYPTRFDQEAIKGLARHGPVWQWLLVIAGQNELPTPAATDPYHEKIKGEKPERLKARFNQLAVEASRIVKAWQRTNKPQ
jgi:hypothetical protein